ncbi:metalloproteinase inhibitor 3-like [Crassostrea virginica]
MMVCLSLLVLIMGYFSGTDACSCLQLDPQSLYCNSAFAVIGKVTEKSFEEHTIVYDVEVTRVYKGIVSEVSVKIKTAKYDSVCGVDLNVNTVYLLNGNLRGGDMWIKTCDMMSLYPINDPERDFPLDTYYDCRCTVLNRFISLDNTKSKNTCLPESRFRCSPDSRALGDLAECRYSEEQDDCAWQC